MRWTTSLGASVGAAWILLLLLSGCANADNPEKTENDGVSAAAEALPASQATAPPQAGGGQGQSIDFLEQRAAAVERKLEPLRQAVRENPDDPDRQLALGRALVDARFHEEGVDHLQRALELDPAVPRMLDLAIGLTFAARLEEAAAIYTDILAMRPDYPVALHNLGNIALRRHELDRAEELFRRALAQRPDYFLAQMHLGDALSRAGKPREAYRAYEKVLSLEPKNPVEAHGFANALYALAELDLMMGAHERAGRFLQELIRFAPDHDKAYYAYGQVLMHLGHPEQAQRAFDKHLELLAKSEPTSAAAMAE